MRIIIDAGHGGSDPGALSTTITEKEINLKIAETLRDKLSTSDHDVTMSRSQDVYISPSARLKMIKSFKPDLFVSIHNDWAASTKASGFSVVYKDKYDYPLAKAILQALDDGLELRNRGLLRDGEPNYNRGLAVLKDLETPAVIVESGFMSNPDDVAYLTNNVDLIAQSIYDGIVEWHAEKEIQNG